MTAYINSLIVVTVFCELAIRLAPDTGTQKKYVVTVCSLAVLLTMIAPIKELVLGHTNIETKVTEFFSANRAETDAADELYPAAAALISYVEENFDVGEDVSLTFVTDESGGITEVQVFLPEADGKRADSVERALGGELNVQVRVFGGG